VSTIGETSRRETLARTEGERLVGTSAIERTAAAMRDWYGPPIAVAGVPGQVYVTKGGDFRGRIRTGAFASALDVVDGWAARAKRGWKHAGRKTNQFNAGFAGLDDLIRAASIGKSRYYPFNKIGPTGVVQVTSSLWRVGPTPPVGSTPAAVPGGTAFDDSSTGGFPFANPASPDTQHFVKGDVYGSVAGNTLLLYDLLFGCAPNMNSTATQSVTGVPTRYQSSTPSAPDFAGGNFLYFQVGGTALAATAHNWTTCLYRDDSDNDAQTLPSLTGNASAIVDRLDHPVGQWFAPLATGDVGIKDLNQLQLSAAVATGVGWAMIGHPIAMLPVPAANIICVTDGVMTAFNLTRIFDDACLAFLEITKPSTTATTYSGLIQSVAN